jgi:hypothetical protein
VEALIPEGPRRAYVQALLDDQDKTRVSKARAAYLEQAVPRIKEKFAMLQQDKGLLALREAAAARKDKAARMFPGVRSPLPILSSEF